MKDIRLDKTTFIGFFQRYHLVMFVVVVVLLLSVAILLLSGIVNKASGVDSVPSGGTTSTFDQATIDHINKLKTSDEPSEPLNL